MAPKKSPKKTETPLPSSNIDKVALALCRYQQEHVEGLRPVFIGRTGTGKTTGWKAIAQEMDLPYVRLLFSQQLPEDIGGWPVATGDSMRFVLMEELLQGVNGPIFLCLDELDKVRKDTMGTLLTLLYEKAIRNYTLHPKTVIVGAMQPVNPSIWLADETGKAISARLTYLPVPYRWGYIEKQFGIQLPHLHEREKAQKIEFPVMEATPRTIECVLSFLRSTQGMTLSREEKRAVLYGTIAKQDAEVLEATLNQTVAWVNPVETAKLDPELTIDSMDVHSLTQHAGPLVDVVTPKAWKSMLTKVWLEGTEEDAKTFLQNTFDHLKSRCEASPEKQCDIFGTATVEEIVKATNEAAEEISKVWLEREKEQKKS